MIVCDAVPCLLHEIDPTSQSALYLALDLALPLPLVAGAEKVDIVIVKMMITAVGRPARADPLLLDEDNADKLPLQSACPQEIAPSLQLEYSSQYN